MVVPPKGTTNYVVTYCPQWMTIGKKKVKQGEEEKEIDDIHEAILFFPLPDGNAKKYKLIGKSNPPEA